MSIVVGLLDSSGVEIAYKGYERQPIDAEILETKSGRILAIKPDKIEFPEIVAGIDVLVEFFGVYSSNGAMIERVMLCPPISVNTDRCQVCLDIGGIFEVQT